MEQNIEHKQNSIPLLSNEHHIILTFCWRLRTGLFHSIKPDRIISYTNWFYQHKILPHIKLEEEYLFPLLGMKNEFVRKAISDHRKLKRLFEDTKDRIKSISLIEEELEKHIRFEEKVLFTEIQKVASIIDFQMVNSAIKQTQPLIEEWKDDFWNITN